MSTLAEPPIIEAVYESLFDAITAAAARPREQSITLPGSAYYYPAFLKFEEAEIFHRPQRQLRRQMGHG